MTRRKCIMMVFDEQSTMALDEEGLTHRFRVTGGEQQLPDILRGPSRIWIDPELLRLYLDRGGETEVYAIELMEDA